MSITKQLLIALVTKIIVAFLSIVSKEIRYLLEEYIKDLYQRAKRSPNPADDMFIEFISQLLCIQLENSQNQVTQDNNERQ